MNSRVRHKFIWNTVLLLGILGEDCKLLYLNFRNLSSSAKEKLINQSNDS